MIRIIKKFGFNMILWLTEIIAQCPKTKKVKKWAGPKVPGIDQKDAENFCQQNGLGYCKVIGKHIESEKDDTNDYFKVQYEN